MFRTLESFDTDFSADSVEWCPSEEHQNIFACGTYQLTVHDTADASTASDRETERKRIGRIYLFKVNDEKLELLQRLDVPAVLDMKWCHVKLHGKTLLGVCNALGFLQIYQLIERELKLAFEISVDDANDNKTIALSLDWSTGRRLEAPEDVKIVVSDSKGSVSLFSIAANGESVERTTRRTGHRFEAWIAAFDYWDTNIFYTGSDDCKFLRFDSRTDGRPTHTNTSHDAGVTSLHSNWKKEFNFVSGSYDETFRMWDTRNFRRPLEQLNLNGGIWRLKWDPYDARYLLAACMYNGFSVVDADRSVLSVVAEYKEHQSIAYGCDWSFKKQEDSPALVATCSFYDHVLKLSSLTLEHS